MNNDTEIIRYLQGKLSATEVDQFEQKLKVDAAFSKEYQSVKQMHTYLLERQQRPTYTKEIDRLNHTYFSKESSSPIIQKAIAFILFLLLAFLLYWFLFKPEPKSLYEMNADHFALHLVTKSDAHTLALNAERAFNQREYILAIKEINKYLKQNNNDTK